MISKHNAIYQIWYRPHAKGTSTRSRTGVRDKCSSGKNDATHKLETHRADYRQRITYPSLGSPDSIAPISRKPFNLSLWNCCRYQWQQHRDNRRIIQWTGTKLQQNIAKRGWVHRFYITMTSWWARWRLKSPASRLFTQPFIQGADQNIKDPRHWPKWNYSTLLLQHFLTRPVVNITLNDCDICEFDINLFKLNHYWHIIKGVWRSSDIALLKWHPHLPGANELIVHVQPV